MYYDISLTKRITMYKFFIYRIAVCCLIFSLCKCENAYSQNGNNTNQAGAVSSFSSDCPPEGSGVSDRIKNLNKLKNRTGIPTKENIDTGITLQKILDI